MKQPPMSLADRLELAAQACHAAGLMSCEATCREAAKELLPFSSAAAAELDAIETASTRSATRATELAEALNRSQNLILHLYGYTHPGGKEAFMAGTGAGEGSLVERGQILYRENEALLNSRRADRASETR